MVRDARYTRILRRRGWKVVRVWEHDLLKKFDKAITKITNSLSLHSGYIWVVFMLY